MMDESAVAKYITDTFRGVDVVVADENYFFFYDPDRTTPPDHRFPFATLVTNDQYDQASRLDRPGVFRLNLGVGQATYQGLFGAPPARPGASGVVETGHNFTVLDQIMPHPIYANMFWLCVLSPSDATFGKSETVARRSPHARAARG